MFVKRILPVVIAGSRADVGFLGNENSC